MPEVVQRLKRISMSREEFEKLLEGASFYDYIVGKAVEANGPSRRQRVIWE